VDEFGRAREATDDSITRRLRFACWITKATGIHSICNTFSFSTFTVVTRNRFKTADFDET
jgi:hypothetical protein